MFSKTHGIAIAKELFDDGTSRDIKLLGYDNQEYKTYISNVLKDMVEQKEISIKEAQLLKSAIYDNNTKQLDDFLLKVYELMQNGLKQKFNVLNNGKEYLTMDTLKPKPIIDGPTERCCMFISGKSGSGKSYMSKNILKQFPDDMIKYLFSFVDEDESLEGIPNLHRIDMNTLIENPINDISELENSVCLFDDCNATEDKELKKVILDLQSKILEHSRHYFTNCICTTHLLCNHNQTRTLISESNQYCFFRNTPRHQKYRFMKEYLGFDDKTIKKICKLPSRFICINMEPVPHCVYEGGCFIIT